MKAVENWISKDNQQICKKHHFLEKIKKTKIEKNHFQIKKFEKKLDTKHYIQYIIIYF